MNSYKEHIRRNLSLAFPVMMSQLGHVMVGVADSVMVGRLGTEPLAAVSLANSLFYIIFMFGVGVSIAVTPLVAAADGQLNTKRSAEVFRNGLWINITTGISLFLLIMGISPVLYHLNQPAHVVELALPYLGIISLSVIPFMFFQNYKQFAEGLSFTRIAMVITISANLVNVLLNYLFIYGKFGLDPMGVNGAGWATLISRMVMGISMAVYIYRSSHFKKYRLHLNIFDFQSRQWYHFSG